jgi:hypothetical protein
MTTFHLSLTLIVTATMLVISLIDLAQCDSPDVLAKDESNAAEYGPYPSERYYQPYIHFNRQEAVNTTAHPLFQNKKITMGSTLRNEAESSEREFDPNEIDELRENDIADSNSSIDDD